MHVLLKMGALWQSMPPKMTTLRYREGGEGGAECNHHDDVYHMYDVMVDLIVRYQCVGKKKRFQKFY